MKKFLLSLLFLPFVSYSQSVKGHIQFQYRDAIEHFLTNPDKSFLPKQDTIYFMSIDKADVGKLPNQISGYYLKFISWEDAQMLLKSRTSLEVYQVFATKFESSQYSIHFLPATISIEGMERNYSNACVIGYKKQSRSRHFQYERMLCGFNAVM